MRYIRWKWLNVHLWWCISWSVKYFVHLTGIRSMNVHTVYPNCSHSIFVSSAALLFNGVSALSACIIAIALDYYLQYYYWIICIICSGLLCINTGLFTSPMRQWLFSNSLSPPVSIKRGVQYIEQYIPARLALQNNTNLVFAKTFGVFSISKIWCIYIKHGMKKWRNPVKSGQTWIRCPEMGSEKATN